MNIENVTDDEAEQIIELLGDTPDEVSIEDSRMRQDFTNLMNKPSFSEALQIANEKLEPEVTLSLLVPSMDAGLNLKQVTRREALKDRKLEQLNTAMIAMKRQLAEQKLTIANLEREKKKLERENRTLKNEAKNDRLTGLWNYRSKQYRKEDEKLLKSVKGRGDEPSIAILMQDLDNFKDFNDLNGHVGGDRLLIKYAELLQSNFRSGSLVARVSGDEFLVAITLTSGEEKGLEWLEERLIGIEESLRRYSEGFGVTVGVSTGICIIDTSQNLLIPQFFAPQPKQPIHLPRMEFSSSVRIKQSELRFILNHAKEQADDALYHVKFVRECLGIRKERPA